MSYDIHEYPPDSPTPSTAQAKAFLDAQEKRILRLLSMPPDFIPDPWTAEENARREAIVAALMTCNPTLSRANPDFGKMAVSRRISVEQARAHNQHASLNPPVGDLAIQVKIWQNSASISVPYRYQGDESKQVFQKVLIYLKVIRNTAGYFAFDPQTGNAFDPVEVETYPGSRYSLARNTFRSAIALHARNTDPKQ